MSSQSNNPLTNKKSLLMMALMLGSATAANIRNLNWDDPGCNTFSADGSCCLKCSFRFYMGANGRCAQVSDHCKTWDDKTGACTSCYPGYGDPCNGVCSTTPVVGGGTGPDAPSHISSKHSRVSRRSDWKSSRSGKSKGSHKTDCQSKHSGKSSKKSHGSRSKSRSRSRSHSLPENCKRANSRGKCIQCVDTYHPIQGVCYPNVGTPPDTSNCAVWGYYDIHKKYYSKWFDGCKKVCTQCNPGFYLDANNLCNVLTGNCLAADVNGNCTQCQPGFCKQNGKCVIRIVQQEHSTKSSNRSKSRRSRNSHSKKSKGSRSRSNSRSKRSGIVGQGNSRHSKKEDSSRLGIWVDVGSHKSKRNDSPSRKSNKSHGSKSKRSHDSKSRKSAHSKTKIQIPSKISIKINQVKSKKSENRSHQSKHV